MNILFPKIRFQLLPTMFGYSAVGGLVAGIFGALHDQVTYSISPEYFTQQKFVQFGYADFGFAPRVFVAEIGFLATWWFGAIAAWFIARVAVPGFSGALAVRYSLRGVSIIITTTVAASLIGYFVGVARSANEASLAVLTSVYHIVDTRSFILVAYIHAGSYSGGFLGLIGAVVYLQRLKLSAKREKPNQTLEPTRVLGTSAAEPPRVPSTRVAHL